LTWRRLRVLLDGLPPESATKTAIRDGMSLEQWESLPTSQAWGAWSHTDHLMATVADRLAWVQWTLVALKSEKGKAPKPPEPLPRPGVGGGPMAALAAKERTEHIRAIALLKARERAHGAAPTDEQVQAVLDEMTGGVGDE
jgi:hypothetical protein